MVNNNCSPKDKYCVNIIFLKKVVTYRLWNYHILVYYFKIYSYSWSVFKSKNIPEMFAEQLFSLWFQYTFRDKNKLHFTKRCAFYHCQLEVDVYKHTTSCGWQQVFIALVCTFTAEMKPAKEAHQPLDKKHLL